MTEKSAEAQGNPSLVEEEVRRLADRGESKRQADKTPDERNAEGRRRAEAASRPGADPGLEEDPE